jgi:hypothetical protein
MAAVSPRPQSTELFTDLGEITMAQADAAEQVSNAAFFDFPAFVR